MLAILAALLAPAASFAPQDTDAPAVPVTVGSDEAPTSQEQRIERFCRRIARTMMAGDPEFFDAAIDVDALLDRSFEDLAVEPDFAREFRIGVESSFAFADQVLANLVQSNGRLDFLRQSSVDPPRAILRSVGDDGLTYYELSLHVGEGRIRIVDIEPKTTGEPMSTSLRRHVVAAAASVDRSLLEKLVGADSDYARALPTLLEINQAFGTDDARLLELYATLPESVQRMPSILMTRIQAAWTVDEELYLAALEDFARWHPDSAALDLLLIDVHFLGGDFEQALECVDRLDASVGGDPYLDVMRANASYGAGRVERAVEFAERAAERDPRIGESARWVLVEIGLDAPDHELVHRALLALESEHGVEFIDLRGIEAYAGFLESRPGKRWYQRWLDAQRSGSRDTGSQRTGSQRTGS